MGERRRGAAVTSADGIGGWGEDAAGSPELRLLVTAFSPETKTADGKPVHVEITFPRPPEWAAVTGMQVRVISDCHFTVQLNHFTPDCLTVSVAVFLK